MTSKSGDVGSVVWPRAERVGGHEGGRAIGQGARRLSVLQTPRGGMVVVAYSQLPHWPAADGQRPEAVRTGAGMQSANGDGPAVMQVTGAAELRKRLSSLVRLCIRACVGGSVYTRGPRAPTFDLGQPDRRLTTSPGGWGIIGPVDLNSADEIRALVHRVCGLTGENEWLEFKVDRDDPHEIGEYISCLSNSAALSGQETAFMLWGIS